VFCSNQVSNSRQMDLSGPGIAVKLKEKKRKEPIFFLGVQTVDTVGRCITFYLSGNIQQLLL